MVERRNNEKGQMVFERSRELKELQEQVEQVDNSLQLKNQEVTAQQSLKSKIERDINEASRFKKKIEHDVLLIEDETRRMEQKRRDLKMNNE